MYHCHTGISKRSLGPAAFQEQGGDAHERCLLLDDLVPSCSSEMLPKRSGLVYALAGDVERRPSSIIPIIYRSSSIGPVDHELSSLLPSLLGLLRPSLWIDSRSFEASVDPNIKSIACREETV